MFNNFLLSQISNLIGIYIKSEIKYVGNAHFLSVLAMFPWDFYAKILKNTLNIFVSIFIVFCDHENMGIYVKSNTVAWLVMEISEEIGFSLMAALICIFLKMLKGAKVASSSF